MLIFIALIASLTAVNLSVAQTLSFPLEGYFRPGKCMPVEFSGSPPKELTLPDAIPVRIEDATEKLVPVLMLGERAVSVGPHSLVPLSDRQKLVLVIGADFEAAAQIFPEFSATVVRRSASLAGPSLGWEAVDALVLDQPLPPVSRDTFLAQGTTLVLNSTQKPDDEFPWQPFGQGWILRSIAPDLASNASSIYEPTVGWKPAANALSRQALLGLTTLAALISLATFLSGARWRKLIQVAVFVAMLGGLLAFYRGSSPVHRKTLQIDLVRKGIGQEDRWDYYKTNVPATETVHGKPLPADFAHARSCKLTEIVRGSDVQWQFHLEPAAAFAFVSRLVVPSSTTPFTTERLVQSSLTTMAQSVYGRAGSVIEGGGPDDASQYTSIRISDR